MTPDAPPCPGCGLIAQHTDGVVPSRYAASPGCWQRYELLLARSYGDPAYGAVHQLVVDAYAAQHPKTATADQIKQVALCLMTLALFVEEGADVRRGPQLHQRMAANLPELGKLDPPDTRGLTTVDDILQAHDPVEHGHLVRTWASEVWQAWAAHHATIRRWNEVALGG